MAGKGRPKGSHDIAPMIRGAFIRAVKGLEDDGKPLSSLVREQLEDNPLATLKAMAAFNPKESNVRQRNTNDPADYTDEELMKIIRMSDISGDKQKLKSNGVSLRKSIGAPAPRPLMARLKGWLDIPARGVPAIRFQRSAGVVSRPVTNHESLYLRLLRAF